MLDFLIDNIFVLLGGQMFQQTIDTPLLADLFLCEITNYYLTIY